MNVFVLKGRWILLVCAVALSAGLIAGTGAAMSVFRVGNRDLPIYSVERPDQKIAITFDCAWNDDDIDSILKTLDQYQCKATFFLLGDWAQKYPESVKKIQENGHELGSHSFNHKDYTTLTADQIRLDMEKCDEAIKAVTGEAPRLFRAPSGAYNNTVVKTAEDSGRLYIQWSVDSLDYGDAADAEGIFRRSTEKTAPGDILLMHNGTKYTAVALPRILDNLRGRFEPVTVSQLLYEGDYVLDHAGRMHATGSSQKTPEPSKKELQTE